MRDTGVLIVGGGLAAQRCAEALRRRGYDGPVRIVCAEPDPPYDRPPLSKEVLAGAVEEDSVAYRPRLVVRGEARSSCCSAPAPRRLDPGARTVRLDSGERAGLRQAADRDRRRRAPAARSSRATRTSTPCAPSPTPGGCAGSCSPGARLAIVGAGFIGQEVAATARGLGVEVTMIEALATPLAPILGDRVRRLVRRAAPRARGCG